MQTTTVWGISSKWLVMSICVKSILQSIVVITTFTLIYSNAANPRWCSRHFPEHFSVNFSTVGVTIFSAKIVFSGILLLGQILKSPGCFLAFIVSSIIHALLTLSMAFAGINIRWSYYISLLLFFFLVLDTASIIIVYKILKKMHAAKKLIQCKDYAMDRNTQDNRSVTKATMHSTQPVCCVSHFKKSSCCTTSHSTEHSSSNRRTNEMKELKYRLEISANIAKEYVPKAAPAIHYSPALQASSYAAV